MWFLVVVLYSNGLWPQELCLLPLAQEEPKLTSPEAPEEAMLWMECEGMILGCGGKWQTKVHNPSRNGVYISLLYTLYTLSADTQRISKKEKTVENIVLN